MARFAVLSKHFIALAIAVTLAGCGGAKPEGGVEEIESQLNASVPGRGSGLLWRFPSGELRVWDMASSSDYKEFTLGFMDPAVWQLAGTGDFAAHGASDILWRNERDRTVGLWLMSDTRASTTSSITGNMPNFPLIGAGSYVGDLDGDGTSDVIWTGGVQGGPPSGTSYIAATYMMSPGTTVPRSTSTVSSPTDRVMGVGNFDGDPLRQADVLHRSYFDDVHFTLANGGTIWIGHVASTWLIKGVGDFNGDQTSDILWYNASSGEVALWMMGSGGIVSGPVPGVVPASSGWSIQGIADVDHDGISDILWRHTSNVVAMWMMNNDGSVREYGPFIPIDPGATFAGVLELGAPPPPLNPFVAAEYLENGRTIIAVRFTGQAQRPNDYIEVLDPKKAGGLPIRVPYQRKAVPNVMEATFDSAALVGGARGCFRVRVWEQGRVSTYSKPICAPGLSAPVASLTWYANDGFGLDENVDGAIDLVPFAGAVNFLRNGTWPVFLDACASNDAARGTITNYTWTVAFPTGPITISTANCRVVIPMPKGTRPATLTITTKDGRTASASTDIDARTYLIVSMGDSYASGEGNPVRDLVFRQAPAFWGTPSDTLCHRSANSGPARAALALERSDPHTAVVFLSVACSGAVISNLIDHRQFTTPLPSPQDPQIQQVRNVLCPSGTDGNCSPGDMPAIDALMLSIGGNDVEFGDIVATCALAPGSCAGNVIFVTGKEFQLALIPAKLQALSVALTALNAPRILITEYPDGVHMDSETVCPEITLEGAIGNSADLHIGHDDLVWAADFIRRLDQTTHDTVGSFPGWGYVGGMNSRFDTHGYCMPDTWEIHHNVSQRRQDDPRGTLHPNTGGLNAYAEAILFEWYFAGIGLTPDVFNFIPPGNVAFGWFGNPP